MSNKTITSRLTGECFKSNPLHPQIVVSPEALKLSAKSIGRKTAVSREAPAVPSEPKPCLPINFASSAQEYRKGLIRKHQQSKQQKFFQQINVFELEQLNEQKYKEIQLETQARRKKDLEMTFKKQEQRGSAMNETACCKNCQCCCCTNYCSKCNSNVQYVEGYEVRVQQDYLYQRFQRLDQSKSLIRGRCTVGCNYQDRDERIKQGERATARSLAKHREQRLIEQQNEASRKAEQQRLKQEVTDKYRFVQQKNRNSVNSVWTSTSQWNQKKPSCTELAVKESKQQVLKPFQKYPWRAEQKQIQQQKVVCHQTMTRPETVARVEQYCKQAMARVREEKEAAAAKQRARSERLKSLSQTAKAQLLNCPKKKTLQYKERFQF